MEIKALALVGVMLISAARARAADQPDWSSAKKADIQMDADYRAYYQGQNILSQADYAKMASVMDDLWAMCQKVESDDSMRAVSLRAAIAAKVIGGEMSQALADDLTSRVDKIHEARLSVVYGYMWRQAMVEGFSGFPVGAQSYFGQRIARTIDMGAYAKVKAENAFDPLAYGLPDDFFKKIAPAKLSDR